MSYGLVGAWSKNRTFTRKQSSNQSINAEGKPLHENEESSMPPLIHINLRRNEIQG